MKGPRLALGCLDERGGMASRPTGHVTVEACEADGYTTQLPNTDGFYDLDLAQYH